MSGRKNTLPPIYIISSGDMSGNLTSSVTNVQYLDFVCIEAVITGTSTGSLDVQVSNDQTNWVSLPLDPPPTITSGSPNPIMIQITQEVAPYIRVVYTASSGTGTLNVTLTARQD